MPYKTVISAAELAAHLHDANWLVLDCRHDLADPSAGAMAFERGHIAGAQHAHLDRDLSGPRHWRTSAGGARSDGGRHPLPDAAELRARLERFGIRDATQVVAVDAQGGMFAARLWWLVRWLGHDAVAVLDGGLPAWLAAGQSLEEGPGLARAPGLLPERPTLTRLADIDSVTAALDVHGGAAPPLIDARAPDRFRGENETIDPVGGHIAGAVNRFFRDNLQSDGRFKPAAQLHDEWAPLVGKKGSTIHYCGSGVTACHNLLALEQAGLPGAALYAGSWSDWISDATGHGRLAIAAGRKERSEER